MSARRSASEEAAHQQLSEILFGNTHDDWEDDDDADADYVPAPNGGDDEDEDEDVDDDNGLYGAEESLSGIEIEFDLSGGHGESSRDDEQGDDDDEGEEGEGRRVYITREQLMRLLGQVGLRHAWNQRRHRGYDDDDNEDESEPDTGYGGVHPRRKRGRGRDAFEKVPSDEGRQLMESGIFGTNDRPEDTIARKKKLAYKIMKRELGLGSFGRQKNYNRLMFQGLIPSSKADKIIHYGARCYSGQFSGDGNFFFSCAQDFKVRMYDTSNPYNWKYYKTVNYPYGQWTITDASLSPDNRFLAYSSIRSIVCLASTDPADDSEPHILDFANAGGRHTRARYAFPYFGIWSLRFSGDGREIVAGTGDRSVYVYDLETRQSVLRIAGHDNDVNAVCYGDEQSPHILYSGSDDTTLKVWDRRSLGDGREAGVFLGHTEGLTYVDSKGDGRYVLSNAKDQTAKLWDLRKMMSKEKADTIDPDRYSNGFEYRSNHFDFDDWRPHPHDCSLVTFRGHQVLKTLIRCHFSPPGSTDSRYIYSGSYDGKVYIWNLDATLAGKVDVYQATRNYRPRDPDLMYESLDSAGNGSHWQTCVRDASWHPNAPVIAATSWNGWGTSFGTCSVHSWRDGADEEEGDLEHNQSVFVNERLERDENLYRSQAGYRAGNRRRTTILRSLHDDDGDDD